MDLMKKAEQYGKLHELTSELLELLDEIENGGYRDYEEMVKLQEKEKELRSELGGLLNG